MACSIRRPYKPAVLRGLNQRSSTRRPTAATPRRIWKLRGQILRRFALLGSGCCFCALGACCFSRGPSATVRRGRGGRAAGEPTDGLAFSRGQEPARKARPRLTDFPSMDGRKASPRGVVFSWLLLFWTSKREVARAPAGARNRFVARDNAEARAPTPTLSRRERDSPISTFPNSSRSASLFKARACDEQKAGSIRPSLTRLAQSASRRSSSLPIFSGVSVGA